ncbi:MAG: hypothetical protein H6Q90_4973 [Deltaproteobacteria bacterium]|nr:hypothetical protein [Deltaproteobacteria bacterium]
MRAALLAVVACLAACTDTTLGNDTAFRRLVEGFSSYDECIANGSPNQPCYQTLTLCSSGSVLMDLDNHQQEGSYQLDGDSAVLAKFTTATILFDLDTATSSQLPGKPWERVEPTFYGCNNQ